MISCCLQFGIIINKLVWGVSLFGFSAVFVISTIVDKKFGYTKLDFKGLGDNMIV